MQVRREGAVEKMHHYMKMIEIAFMWGPLSGTQKVGKERQNIDGC